MQPGEADLIIVGGKLASGESTVGIQLTSGSGGGAGCVIASRLAEAFPELDVLLVEKGADNREAPRLARMSRSVARLTGCRAA